MNKAQTVIEAAKNQIGSPYVFGAWGQLCTPSMRKKYAGYNPSHKEAIYRKCPVLNGKAPDCEGCRYEGKRAFDCRGFTHWCLKQVGIDIAGSGATSQWNTSANWAQKGTIDEMPDVVCCVFKQDGKVMQHTGMHIGGGQIIHCSVDVQTGAITDRGWTHYAIPAGLYEEVGAKVVLRQGSRGDQVKQLQEWLNQLGYDCGTVDGIYGEKTAKAVKKFQGDNGLSIDGIAGEKTQTSIALQIAKQGIGDGSNTADNTIPHQTLEALKTALNAIKTQAEQTAEQAKQALRLLEEGGAK